MKISVIIPTLNRADDLRCALESILRQTYPPFEVLIIDQSPGQETYRLSEELKDLALERKIYLRYVRQSEKSLVKARNRGLLLALGDILSFIDDDVVLLSDYYEEIAKAFEQDPDVAGVAGNVIVREKLSGLKWTIRRTLMKFFLLSDFKGNMTASGFGTPIFEREIQGRMEVEMLPGCDMNFRASEIGDQAFDEWFVGYSFREDVDFSYRIAMQGRCVMLENAKLYHNHSPASRLNVKSLTTMTIKNYHYVFKKYKNQHFYSPIIFAYSLLGLIFIDAIEFLFRRDQQRLTRLRAEVQTSWKILWEACK